VPEEKYRGLYRTLGVCNARTNAREELNFGGPNFDIEDLFLRELRSRIRSESPHVDLRKDRQSDERTLRRGVWFSRLGARGLRRCEAAVLIVDRPSFTAVPDTQAGGSQ
jgi:hypothetical protein